MKRRKLNIGITCYPTYGGSGIIATEIGLEMARRAHHVHFICLDVPRRLHGLPENVFYHEVEILDYPLFTHPPYDINLASKMVEVATDQNLDLVHVHYAVPHATSAYLASQVMGETSPKIITTLHGTDITLVGNDRSYLPITRFSIFQSDGVTAPSLFLKQATYDQLNLSTQTEIEVIPNFVDTELFRPPDGQAPNPLPLLLDSCFLPASAKIISHTSNFRPVKRLHDVIAIFAAVQKEVDCHLVLIGDGPDRPKTQALVRELGLSNRVCFLGKRDSFVDILQHSDLFLLPSVTESFGLAALEAMSCGVPVIASDVGGLPEVVLHGQCGFLAPVGDIQSMAGYALRLLSDSAEHERFSQAARKRTVNEFRLADIVSLYEDYYYRVLD